MKAKFPALLFVACICFASLFHCRSLRAGDDWKKSLTEKAKQQSKQYREATKKVAYQSKRSLQLQKKITEFFKQLGKSKPKDLTAEQKKALAILKKGLQHKKNARASMQKSMLHLEIVNGSRKLFGFYLERDNKEKCEYVLELAAKNLNYFDKLLRKSVIPELNNATQQIDAALKALPKDKADDCLGKIGRRELVRGQSCHLELENGDGL